MSDETKREIMRAARHLTASRMARIANDITPGTNWLGCAKGYIAESLATGRTRRDTDSVCLRFRMASGADGRTGIRLEDAEAVLEIVERHRAVVRKLQPQMGAESGTALNFKVFYDYQRARSEAARLTDALREAGWKGHGPAGDDNDDLA